MIREVIKSYEIDVKKEESRERKIDELKEDLELSGSSQKRISEMENKPEKALLNPRKTAEVRAEVSQYRGLDGRGKLVPVDKKVFGTVVGLNRWNVKTDDCDEGHLFLDRVGKVPYAYVHFIEDSITIAQYLLDVYNNQIQNGDSGLELVTTSGVGGGRICPKDRTEYPNYTINSLRDLYNKWRQINKGQKTIRQFGDWLQEIPDNYDFTGLKTEIMAKKVEK